VSTTGREAPSLRYTHVRGPYSPPRTVHYTSILLLLRYSLQYVLLEYYEYRNPSRGPPRLPALSLSLSFGGDHRDAVSRTGR
jgi:hypothetical protein